MRCNAAAEAEVAGLLDTLGYDAVDVGSLAESWRSEPGTPVYVQPYFPAQRPEGLPQEESFRWFLDTPGVAVPADRVKELTANAVRGAAGGSFPGHSARPAVRSDLDIAGTAAVFAKFRNAGVPWRFRQLTTFPSGLIGATDVPGPRCTRRAAAR